MTTTAVYKLLTEEDWHAAEKAGYTAAAVDLAA